MSSAQPEPATTHLDPDKTDVGSVFVSNYPPYSFWSEDAAPEIEQALNTPPQDNVELGLYLHIPFCRRRCNFCYFRVYTDKNARDIERYLANLLTEIEIYSRKPSVAGRRLKFIYFGGGTPSYISARHLRETVDRIKQLLPWDTAQEITFECEPGTLTQSKIEAIREIGVTRISLGVENFDDDILRENGRAHVSAEIERVLPWIRQQGFDQLNIDLIAGMVGETWDSWKRTVERTAQVSPDSVTIYQLELPFNTVYSSHLMKGEEISVADWDTKRAWHDYAFQELQQRGYRISSAYTLLKKDQNSSFVYRDAVWEGCDLLGTGVASFGHVGGIHIQNLTEWEGYNSALEAGGLPLKRGYVTTPDERLVREMILNLKLGRLATDRLGAKFNVDIAERFAEPLQRLRQQGWLEYDNHHVELTRDGLLRVDQLLPEFYSTQHRGARYT